MSPNKKAWHRAIILLLSICRVSTEGVPTAVDRVSGLLVGCEHAAMKKKKSAKSEIYTQNPLF